MSEIKFNTNKEFLPAIDRINLYPRHLIIAQKDVSISLVHDKSEKKNSVNYKILLNNQLDIHEQLKTEIYNMVSYYYENRHAKDKKIKNTLKTLVESCKGFLTSQDTESSENNFFRCVIHILDRIDHNIYCIKKRLGEVSKDAICDSSVRLATRSFSNDKITSYTLRGVVDFPISAVSVVRGVEDRCDNLVGYNFYSVYLFTRCSVTGILNILFDKNLEYCVKYVGPYDKQLDYLPLWQQEIKNFLAKSLYDQERNREMDDYPKLLNNFMCDKKEEHRKADMKKYMLGTK
jgi:hypothetical protein